jgi:hypothetical protein
MADKGSQAERFNRGTTCQVTAFRIPNPPGVPHAGSETWMAIATSHVYDADIRVPGLRPGDEVLAGETMRVVSARSMSNSERGALLTAFEDLLFQLGIELPRSG